MKRTVLAMLCLAVSAASLFGAFWYWNNVYAEIEVPMAPIPSPTVSSITVPVNDDEKLPPVDMPENPRGKLDHLVIYHGGKAIVSMDFGPATYDSLGWGSECGKVAYRDRDDFPKPGFASKNRSLVSGHVWCDRETYTLNDLDKVRKGDRVEVYYSSGDVAVGQAEADAAALPKDELNAEHKGQVNPRLRNSKKLRTMRVSTCDTDSPVRANGHLSANVYVLYTFKEIRFAEQ